ncbi:Phenoxybenzoate dioxygenase subunit beta [Cupriavidus yeoncheonensis]|uniref:Phenoxybenzoate dioxygenase subunit beta n=1 Tax=Cupriavidus yeoncheonensis TaxID=1462994 RepID=A0A916IUG2_9BURK|nr:PDR/VanB family oxidoreductase [Cupriavidus yeoncheonensis]CAG2147331.1 Phenoxybenzoate dioxygenase subunit beta [Cupriavidus yeoncheonensis]
MELIVTSLRLEAEGVLGVELRDAAHAELPPFAPGAHVDVSFPNGLTRQYSIASAASDRTRYWLGIGLAPASRGGSRFAHSELRLGDRLPIGAPRSLFGLHEAAAGHLFVAGGIGITPILSMIRQCIEQALPWRLLYCVRSRRHAAYLEQLAPFADRVVLHADDEQDGHADIAGALRQMPSGWHVYTCGPGAMMDAVCGHAAVLGIDHDAVHLERFGAAAVQPGDERDAFQVRLLRHGGRFTVPREASILEVLEANGVCLPFSCREGLCRSCEVPLAAGVAEHRDYVLSDEERIANKSILICVSRAKGAELVLDV